MWCGWRLRRVSEEAAQVISCGGDDSHWRQEQESELQSDWNHNAFGLNLARNVEGQPLSLGAAPFDKKH